MNSQPTSWKNVIIGKNRGKMRCSSEVLNVTLVTNKVQEFSRVSRSIVEDWSIP
ncbi:MAG: hypothetical protein WCH39_27810 [Schlesneria sp.]